MPAPKPDDPLRCPGSDITEGWRVTYGRFDRIDRWVICPACKRVLKKIGGPHRVRSRTTASLDKTRDILADMTQVEIASATATDPTRRTRVTSD